ncbi:MAG: hypothetical protein JNM76_14665 [Betaproteobacteria bacterium]|nr:hypothetical protein [Betaproteobacteria bacterium]
METRVTLDGLLKPGELEAWTRRKQKEIAQRVKQGMLDARPETDRIMREENRRAFKVVNPRMDKSWRANVYTQDRGGQGHGSPRLVVKNLSKWFKIQTTGGVIRNKTTPRALLIPINTAAGSRIGTKKFYKMIAWLRQNKWTVIRNGILYVRPPMNESRRGGVAAGSRINKKFRSTFSGSFKRPSGFDIKLNEQGLTPIAIIRTSITMKKRMDLDSIARRRLLPVVAARIRAALGRAQYSGRGT